MLGVEAFSGDAPVSKTGEQGSIPCGPATPPAPAIVAATARHYGITVDELLRDNRQRAGKANRPPSAPVARRWLAMWLLRERYGKRRCVAARAVRRDASTVDYGVRQFREACLPDLAWRGAVEMIERRLGQ